MLFLLNERLITIASIILLLILIFGGYVGGRDKINEQPQQVKTTGAYDAKHKITIDPNKEYDDYSVSEKALYHLFKDDIERAKVYAKGEGKKKADTSTQIP